MERRYALRLEQMLAQAEVPPEAMRDLLTRLDAFVAPFAATLTEAEQRRHAAEYLTGLLSKLQRKTGEAIAYLHDQERQGLQKFLGHVPWDHRPLLATLARQVGSDLGEPDAVLVFDPSAFAKKGTKSVGVARQWCGRLGKVENCQVGVFLAYASRKGHAIVDVRLYLPKEWAKDRPRRKAAGVPTAVKFRTRQQLALEMLDGCGGALPHAWVAGDDEMGRPSGFRRDLRGRGERYLLGVPSNTLIRDLDVPPPEYAGRGRRPKTPFARLDRWRSGAREEDWAEVTARDGEKGPLVIGALKRRVAARTATGGTGPEELLFVTRERQADNTFKHDYYLSNAGAETSLQELARVAKAAHRVEECLERAKGEAGLADYQVRNWIAWHHHQTLSLLAAWFLNRETRRGKNPDARLDDTATAAVDRRTDRGPPRREHVVLAVPAQHPLVAPQRTGSVLPPSLT
ncbi:MAG TPA: IS701 family transposase [Gemmataceae bacterium]|nr:IS701 family transposase [Gemmataceae bacterium]